MRNYTEAAVISNKPAALGIFDMTIKPECDMSDARPGQFAHIYIPKGEHILARPISICEFDKENGLVRMLYQVAGQGTEYLSTVASGQKLKLIVLVGNGFNTAPKKKSFGLVGGGIGIPPLLELAKTLKAKHADAEITAFFGYRSKELMILEGEFEKHGVSVNTATDDGSFGFKGNVIALMDSLNYSCDMIFACGPKIMLKFLAKWASGKETPCFVSMEERMACGVGACLGCVVPMKNKDGEVYYKKVCKDGPVFNAQEVAWDA